jgi:hypothetical protein
MPLIEKSRAFSFKPKPAATVIIITSLIYVN